jgi:hypothetical protein
MDITAINNRINSNHCDIVENELSDEKLMPLLLKQPSVKNKIEKLKEIFKTHVTSDTEINNIINDPKWLKYVIPPGTKGVLRGNKFNKIIQKKINELKLDKRHFNICFEKKCSYINTDEIPDWFILEISTKKVIIGMNQLTLWGGGHQYNRALKYLNSKINTEKSKLLCVVCNKVKIINYNKTYDIFNKGYSNDILCYIKNLEYIIKKFFNIK